jgi:acyl-coenzyme A thioesterase PaaI-like protein
MSKLAAPAVQDHYPEDVAHCYGCGRLNPHGHRLKSVWNGSEAVATFTPQTHETSIPGFVYGGLIASLMDCHSMATATAASEQARGRNIGDRDAPRFVTASLKVDYLRPTPLGVPLEIRAHVKHMTERKVAVEVSLAADGHVTARGEVLAVRMPETMKPR